MEKLALRGFLARLNHIQQLQINPLNAEYAQFHRMLEQSHGLPEGSIGTLYDVDTENGKLIKKSDDNGGHQA